MAVKKATKKAAAKHAPHAKGKDARRGYEHLGRVQAIASLATAEQRDTGLLVSTAEAALRSGRYKESADLLRAAEHLLFASIVGADADPVSSDLVSSIGEELDHLRRRAEEHGGAEEAPQAIHAIYVRMAREAEAALRQRFYRRALELARGVDALAQIHDLDENMIPAGGSPKQLQGSR